MAKNKQQNNVQTLSPENYIRLKARKLPFYECLVNLNFEDIGMAQVVISRIHANGNLTLGVYMVDLLCLGVRDTHYRFNSSQIEYQELLNLLSKNLQLEKVSYDLVHNIIFAANEYAEEVGFKPHKDFTLVSQYLLEEDTDDIELMEIECGKDGRPVYVRGESDTDARATQVIHQLEKTVGKGNFDIVLSDEEEDESDDLDDFEERDEYSQLSLIEKGSLFLKLVRKGYEKFTEDEQDRVRLLTDSIFMDICDEDKVNKLMDSWEPESYFSISDDYFTPEFMGIDAGSIITEDDLKFFADMYVLIDKAPSKIPQKLKVLREKWGNIPLICYYELIYLEKEKPKEYALKLDEYSALYPDYALIKLIKYAHSILNIKNKSEAVIIDFEDVFEGRSSITEYEMFDFQSKKMRGIFLRDNRDELEAMYSAIDTLELGEDYYDYLKLILLIKRIDLLKHYLKKTKSTLPLTTNL